MKKVVSLLLSLAIVTTMLFSVTFSVSAYSVPDEKGFAEKLSSLRNQFPNGGYYSGTYYENGTAKAWQCHGYALECFEQVFGIQYYNSGFYNRIDYSMGTIYAGDIVRVGNDSHTIFITKVEGDRIYYTEANYWPAKYGANYVRWDVSYTYSELQAVFTYKVHVPENYLTGNPTPQGHVMSESEGAGRTIPDGDYWICSEVAQDFFLDIPGDSALKEGGANVQMWIWGDKMPTKYDVFHIEYLNNGFYTISQLDSKYSLDVNSGNLERGTNVIMWDSHGGNPQQWSIEKTDHGYAIRARCNNYYLDVSESGKYEKGQNVLVWEGHGGKNQHFSFIPYAPDERPIEDGVYTIWSNVSEPLFLDAGGNPGSFANNTNIQIWNSTGSDYINKVERYKVEYEGDGYYRLFEATSGLSVEIMLDDQSYMIKNKNAILFGKNANRGQLWKIRKNSDGTFFLFNKLAGQCLDLCDAGTTNGTNVFAHPYNGSNAQKWKFRRVLTEEMVNVSGWIKDNGFYQPVISVTIDGKKLELNKDYTVDLRINNDTLYADIEGVGNYSGIISIPYENPKNDIGDTDLDGYITISDVTAIQRHLAELAVFTEEQLSVADTNGDGKVDISDATHLQKYLAEFDGIVLGKQTA